MIVFPNAKINIGLNITNRREDGFHDIETVFYPVNLFDKLEFVLSESDKDEFKLSGIDIPSDGKKNLVERALDILRENHEVPALKISLEKHIPAGAGLGGGSSDAAFFLKSANEEFNLGINHDELVKMASRLGADCAFFIDNEPKFATGKGDVFSDAPFLDKKLIFVLIKPEFGISTPFAYSKVKPQPAKSNLFDDFTRPISAWNNCIKNDFEQFLFPYHPKLQELKDKLYSNGAIYASMTGSGSALFGIWENEPVLDDELQSLRVF